MLQIVLEWQFPAPKGFANKTNDGQTEKGKKLQQVRTRLKTKDV